MRRYGGRLRRDFGNSAVSSRTKHSFSCSSLGVEPLEVRALLAINTIFAVNAGGPQVVASDSTVWEADTAASPSIYSNQSASGSGTFGNNKNVNTGSIAPEIPTSIFNTERYDGGGVPMQWDFPVTPGNYEVRLYFAEIYNGAHSVGGRVFDVSIEGNTVLPSYDTFAEAGPDTAIMESFIVSSDSNLDIDFAPIVQNPAIKGIEILEVSENGTLGVSASSLNFASVEVGQSLTQQVTLTHLGDVGDSDITVQSTAISGAASFTDNFNDATGVVLSPGQSTQISVTFSPTAEGAQAASLQVTHSGVNSPISLPLSGTGTVSPVGSSLIRINAGGPAVGSPEWSADTTASPSPLSNVAAAQSSTFATGQTIDTTDASIPTGTPASIFSTERYDLLGGEEMQWDIPVTAGPYEVRLYFAETFGGNAVVGARVFDVSIEGQLVLDDYDVFADVGSAFKGVMKSFNVVSDGNLDIDLDRVTENPAIKAIEIVSLQEPNLLIVDSETLDFGAVFTGSTATQSITVTNSGQAGDPSITLNSTTIVGSATFTDNFDDINGAVLAPGESVVIDVTFDPDDLIAQAATLQIQHTGTNSPLSIALSGIGSDASPIGFSKSSLAGIGVVQNPTSLQWGPDDRLYVAHQNGTIFCLLNRSKRCRRLRGDHRRRDQLGERHSESQR